MTSTNPPVASRKILYVIFEGATPGDVRAAMVQFRALYHRHATLIRMSHLNYIQFLGAGGTDPFDGVHIKPWPIESDFWSVVMRYADE